MVSSNFNYGKPDLAYLKNHAAAINSVAAALGIPPEAVAAGVMREMTLTSQYYPRLPARDRVGRAVGQQIQNVITAAGLAPEGFEPLTHDEIAANYAHVTDPSFPERALNNPNRYDRFWHVTLNDVGPGKVQLKTAIDYLKKYDSDFPETDPLNLKNYKQHYDTLLKDLKDPDNDVTFKISGLISKGGIEFFRVNLPNGAWDALSKDQQTALLTQYYARGKANVANSIDTDKGDGFTPEQIVGDLLSREPSRGALFGTNPRTLSATLRLTKSENDLPARSVVENPLDSNAPIASEAPLAYASADGRRAQEWGVVSSPVNAPSLRTALEQRAADLGVAYGAYMPTDALLAEIHGREGDAAGPQDADATADRIEQEMDTIGAPLLAQPETAEPPPLGLAPPSRPELDQRAAAFGVRFGAAVPDDRVLLAVHANEGAAAPPAAADALADRIEREIDGTVAGAGIPWSGGDVDGDGDADEAQA